MSPSGRTRWYSASSCGSGATFAIVYSPISRRPSRSLAVDYALLGLIPVAHETQLYVFVVRVLAFGAILWGIYDKNRR